MRSRARMHTENGSASVTTKTMGNFALCARLEGEARWKRSGKKEEERTAVAPAVTAVTAVILLYTGNKCVPLTHASAIALTIRLSLSSLLFSLFLFLAPGLVRLTHAVTRTSLTRREGKNRDCMPLPDMYYSRDEYIENGVVLSFSIQIINFPIAVSTFLRGIIRNEHKQYQLSHARQGVTMSNLTEP